VPDDFSLVETTIPSAPAGGIVVRNCYASLDPAQRGWMDDAPSYMPPIALGDAVRATTVGVVHASASADFAVGDWVMGLNALEDYSVSHASGFTMKVDVSQVDSPSKFLSALGAVGLTAYFGLLDVAKPKPGETLLVSGAAGAVGSAVGQIGRILGCRTIGIAGGADKCRRLIDDYGYDVAIDYKGKSVEQLCGLISEYNSPSKIGVRNLWQVLAQQATIYGYLIMEYAPRFAEGGAQMAQWMAQGRLRTDEDVQHGLDNAYDAFMRLFSGANTGKLVLKIAA